MACAQVFQRCFTEKTCFNCVGPVQVDPYVAEIMKDPDSPKNFTGRALPESSNPSFLQMFVLWKTSRISRLRRVACLIQRRWMRSWASAWQLARLKKIINIYISSSSFESLKVLFACWIIYIILFDSVSMVSHCPSTWQRTWIVSQTFLYPDSSWKAAGEKATWVGGHWSYQHWKIHGNVWCWHITSCQDSCIQKSGVRMKIWKLLKSNATSLWLWQRSRGVPCPVRLEHCRKCAYEAAIASGRSAVEAQSSREECVVLLRAFCT